METYRNRKEHNQSKEPNSVTSQLCRRRKKSDCTTAVRTQLEEETIPSIAAAAAVWCEKVMLHCRTKEEQRETHTQTDRQNRQRSSPFKAGLACDIRRVPLSNGIMSIMLMCTSSIITMFYLPQSIPQQNHCCRLISYQLMSV